MEFCGYFEFEKLSPNSINQRFWLFLFKFKLNLNFQHPCLLFVNLQSPSISMTISHQMMNKKEKSMVPIAASMHSYSIKKRNPTTPISAMWSQIHSSTMQHTISAISSLMYLCQLYTLSKCSQDMNHA